MCEVSEKMQLCTCTEVDFDNAKHYWVYHRFIKGKEERVIGIPVLPVHIDEKIDLANKTLLKTLLNQNTVFDKPIYPCEGDLLELAFSINAGEKRVVYGFKFHNEKWIEEEYDPLIWMWHHTEAIHGKIENAIKNE